MKITRELEEIHVAQIDPPILVNPTTGCSKDSPEEALSKASLKDQIFKMMMPFRSIPRRDKSEVSPDSAPGRYLEVKIRLPFVIDSPYMSYCVVNGKRADLQTDTPPVDPVTPAGDEDSDAPYFVFPLKVERYGNSVALNIEWGPREIEILTLQYVDSTNFFSRIPEKSKRDRLVSLFDNFKTAMHDYDAEHNILIGKELEFNDEEVMRYLDRGVKDLNKGTPQTKYSLFSFPDEGLLTDAAVIFALTAKGMLQLRNQLSYSDAGLSVGLFDKTMAYQQWGSFLLQMYLRDKADFKTSVIPRSANSGFFGISSEFGYRGGRW